MIVVLADDLSGAAELAGAALMRGLTVEVQTRLAAGAEADVLCVDTNTRSLPRDEAARTVREIARGIATFEPDWIYKKCDSVLRGNVLAEIRAIMDAAGKSGAVLISANPGRGRIIRGGEYFVEGRRLHETSFASDPEYPRKTSRVAELLGGDLAGVQTPDAERPADLERHANALAGSVLAAGGVEFFEALLRARTGAPAECTSVGSAGATPGRTLFACGSAAAWAKGRQEQADAHNVIIEPMPDELLQARLDRKSLDRWAEQLVAQLQERGVVMAAIARTSLQKHVAPAELAERLALAVAHALDAAPVARLCAEGGATAAAVARALRWTRFDAERQIAGGVVALRPHAANQTEFVIKVGSYDWPEEIWPRM